MKVWRQSALFFLYLLIIILYLLFVKKIYIYFPDIPRQQDDKHINSPSGRHLARLRRLDLCLNRGLTALPAGLCALAGLEELSLKGCMLTALPEGIGGLAGLQRLFLGGNTKLTTLPAGRAAAQPGGARPRQLPRAGRPGRPETVGGPARAAGPPRRAGGGGAGATGEAQLAARVCASSDRGTLQSEGAAATKDGLL